MKSVYGVATTGVAIGSRPQFSGKCFKVLLKFFLHSQCSQAVVDIISDCCS